MSVNDPISDFLTRLRNGSEIYRPYVDIPYTKHLETIIKVLKEENFVKDFEIIGEGKSKFLRVHLLYFGRKRAINEMKRLSKLSRRIYAGKRDLGSVTQGPGVAVLSTSQGILTSKQAREKGIGGEVLFIIW
ncbi:MAG: 30S ribosomal protein S8 [Candidatus Omnitrophica bacterium]|nr:30S ribosomal protein S8 [Candidatus Omnitrophota bacterium]